MSAATVLGAGPAPARPALPRYRPSEQHARTPALALGVLGAGLAVVAAAVVAGLAEGRQPVVALLFPLLLLPAVLWVRPQVGLFLLFGGTVVIEQFSYEVGPRSGAVTAKVPLFHSVVSGTGVTPAELLLGLLLVIVVARGLRDRTTLLHRSPLLSSIGLLAGLVVLYLAIGLSRGGNVKMGLWEARPFLYLGSSFLLGSLMLTTRRAVRGLLWTLVLGSSAKAAYGVVIFLSVRSLPSRPEAVLAHEESYFFGLYLFLALGLWVFRVPGRLRRVATALAPVVLVADMVNSRRTAWAILAVGLLMLLVTAYVRLPDRRHVLRRLAVVGLAFSVVYVPAFWSREGSLAQPARALRSVIAPDQRDEMSNQYRYVENANLSLNIQLHHSTGTGYGIPIQYAIAMVDLRDVDPYLAYVPHNGVLYVWMRLGLLGEIALWLMVARAVLAACRLSAVPDRETALLGAVVACAVVAYVIMGDKDMGFSWFRIAVCTGTLLGAVEARSRASGLRQRPVVAAPAELA